MNYELGQIDNPHQALVELRSKSPCCATFDFEHQQPYNSHQPVVNLTAVCLLLERGDTELVVVATETLPETIALAQTDPTTLFRETIQRLGKQSVNLAQPWRLQTCRIPKPWGAEIWYTGVEERGVCTVNDMPLPWLIALSPEYIMGPGINPMPLLLKILDPLADAEFGDLYFELHEQKREVYIVTSIDDEAWPDGIGYIRYGFSHSKVSAYANDESFKSAYLDAVEQYRKVRETIDRALDAKKPAANLSLIDPIPPSTQRQWMAELPVSLLNEETSLKATMYSFTELKAICVGDVIRVKPFLPHSLQHGVRVVEFQTAHYERHILSFTQKVMTQSHWDTKTAVDSAIIDQSFSKTLALVEQTHSYRVDSVADYAEFLCWRITLEPHATFTHELGSYALLIGITGQAIVNGQKVNPEQGYLLTASGVNIVISTKNAAVLLLTIPK